MATVTAQQAPSGGPNVASPTRVRRASAWLHRHPKAKLALLLLPPLGWMLVVYLGALSLLFATAFWRLDPLTSAIERTWGLQNFRTLVDDNVYRVIAARTILIGVAVTVTDIALAFPLAYYAARMATRRGRSAILVGVTMPLWSSYLVRVFAWKTILSGGGLADWVMRNIVRAGSVHIGASNWAVWLTFTYLWLPFVILPIYASIERIPGSFLEASSDLGAHAWTTFRRVIWPLAIPGIIAGSIFAFSLTIGDYITPTLVGNRLFIGNVVFNFVSGTANQLPLGAAFALVPVLVMAIYLWIAKRLGAFEAL
jgi:putative spermidine/putrescine transport system permease protein